MMPENETCLKLQHFAGIVSDPSGSRDKQSPQDQIYSLNTANMLSAPSGKF